MNSNGIHEDLIKITSYNLKGKLPNPFVFDNGTPLTDPSEWNKRRAEIYKTAIELQYGTMPPKPEVLKVDPLYIGRGYHPSTYRITTGKVGHTLSFDMTVFKASRSEKCPVAIDGDHCFGYVYKDDFVRDFVDHGVTLVMFNRTALFSDIAWYCVDDTVKDSYEYDYVNKTVEALNRGERPSPLAEIYPEYTFGAIGAWAWGYSRCVDALELLGFADMNCITFTGHSRGGKTAMLAGALDERAAIVNPNETCAGACSCYRLEIKAITEDGDVCESEALGPLSKSFPKWMGPTLKDYVGREEELPFDSHFLKAMVAPRVLFVSEAASDIWANPVGSYITTEAAGEVFKFLGAENNLLWYFRRGYHHHNREDVAQLINVIRHVKYGEPLNDKYGKLPFKKPEPAYDWSAPNK